MTTRSQPETFSGLTKGLPLTTDSIALSEIGGKGWNLLREDVQLPAAILRGSALDKNSKIMQDFLHPRSAYLCPHGKTTMSPHLFQRQMEDGAWGLTVATPQQLRVARHFGHKRILLANQLIGKPAIRYVLDELRDDPEFDFYCLVDSVDGVNQLMDQMQADDRHRPLQVLLEIGFSGQRCGCRTEEEAFRVATAVRDSDNRLALRGIEGFEGLFHSDVQMGAPNPVTDFLKFLVNIARLFEKQKLFSGEDILLTAGGSNYFDLVTREFTAAGLATPVRVILRSGCYLIHDSGVYAKFERQRQSRSQEMAKFPTSEAALEVWTYVQSVPETTLAILTAGKRDCGHDTGMPVPLKWFRSGLHERPVALGSDYVVKTLSDQHAHMQIPAKHDLRVGDMVGLGISHPCTTFDKWRLLFVLDDHYNITGAIDTYF
jgi:D-serine dehydratase